MAISYNPKITTSGLVFAVDAANPKSYPGSGTTWYDLTANGNDLTFQNSVNITYNSSGYFSVASTGYFSRASGTNIPTGNSSYSMSVWARQSGSWGTKAGLISIGGYNTLNQSNALRTNNNVAGQFTHYWWSNDLTGSSSVGLNTWFTVLAQFDGTTRTIWVNGSRVASDTPTGHNVLTSALQVSMTFPGEYQVGDMAAAFIYNRSLTPDEISQNFNALRGRYGI